MTQEILAPGTMFQGRYEVDVLLREDGLLLTYGGRQLATGRSVVLEVLRPARDALPADVARRQGQRFLREMRACARLLHPGIARPIDVGQTGDGRPYAAFELVPGQILAELLAERGALDPEEARHLMLQVLDALGCAHRQGIVHGDLRPAHVLLVTEGARRSALLLGFGLSAVAGGARGAQDGAPASGVGLVGPELYSAPEQLRGYPPTARSDLYAWGLVFLECLTGKRAGFVSAPDGGALQRESPTPARLPRVLLTHPLGALLTRATTEEVAARVGTADGLLRELDACDVSQLLREDLIMPIEPAGATAEEAAGSAPAAPAAPGQGAAAPGQGAAAPGQGAAAPGQGAAALGQGAAAPGQGAAAPGQGAAAPGQDAGMPEPPGPGSPEPAGAAPATSLPSARSVVFTETPASPEPGARAKGAESPPAQAAATPEQPGADLMPVRIGGTLKHYEIIRKLGQGGMGVVFLARDTRLGRLVAIKLLLQYSGHGAKRFLDEARATAQCRHENIVVIHEVDEIRGYPYLVLEYVQGPTLRRWMARRDPAGARGSRGGDAPPGPRAAIAAIELIIPVVRALACAHQHGIVHRDLKPENILLDESGCIKVLDFGIAKRVEAEVAATLAGARPELDGAAGRRRRSAAVGTPAYMSPEQLLGVEVDARADLWAVGITLYELLTGAHPLHPLSRARLASVVDLDVPMPSLRERHPEVGALGALVDRCLEKRKDERIGSARELLAELDALVPGRKPLDLGEEESPFAGLAAFQEADAALFFGRDHDVAAMTARLRHQPLLAVAGPSGAGKSSFVRAGVIPALKRSGDRWEVFVLRPGRRPLAALVDVLAQIDEAGPATGEAAGSPELPDHERLVATLRAQPGYLGARLRAWCRRERKRRQLLLFVDQFEELYTLGAPPEERAAFVACLEGAADDASSPLRVLLAVRADFLERMADHHGLIREVTRGLSFLPPMGREGLREALTRPLEAAGYHFETAELVEHMLGTLEGTRSPLPLLQFTATELWEARDRRRRILTRDSYEQLGGVAGALSAHADAVLAALPPREQRLARAVLLRLVTPERTRAIVSLEELRGLAQGGEGAAGDAVAQVVQHLAAARLLLIETAGGEPGGERDGTTVELVHESLIERWPKLGQWLAEGERDAQFLARLRAAAQQWEASGQAEGLLWRDRAAEDAKAWHERRRAEQGAASHAGLSRREERYLLAVVALGDRARRLRRRLVTGVACALGAIGLIVAYLAIRAGQQATLARQQAARADEEAARAQAEAGEARNATRMAAAREMQADPASMLALLREIEPPDVPRGWAVLARWALHGQVARAVLHHADLVMQARYSPDGRRIVTASWDRTARVWNADGTGEPVVLRGHEDHVNSAAFSPDGRRVVTTSCDRTARVWNADGTGEPIVLRGATDRVSSAAFSPDGRRIVAASWDKTARVWNADGTGEPVVLRGHDAVVYSAEFSPDGGRIVTGSWDRTARVWDAGGAGEPIVLRGHEKEVYSAAFSPDGRRVVTASWDRTARVWNADGTGRPTVLRGHAEELYSAAFSPDGRRIVTASWDKTARVWRADGTGTPMVIGGHEDGLASAAFSPDGERIVTASYDRTARVWDTGGTREPRLLRGHEKEVYSAAFSPDGRRIVTASWDRTARVWRADGTGEPVILRGHEEEVYSAAFSPDGRRVVTASDDRTARVWSAEDAGQRLVLRGHTDGVTSAAFSPDGRRIVTASDDGTARVWSAGGAGEPMVLRGHESAVTSAAFSPDGKRIVTASYDMTARVWGADGAGEPIVLRGHESRIASAAFSPDGRRVVTASYDKTARVWNADGTGEPIVLRGHAHWVLAATFSPDGKHIVTASQDTTTRVWNADGTGEPTILRDSASAVNSAAFSPDGRSIVTASDDKVARVWTEIEPLRGVNDPKLWAATTYCMPVERRVELLRVPEAMARASLGACRRRVAEARR